MHSARHTDSAEPNWTLRTRSGTMLCVPGSLSSLTTFVLLEQESWFEPEIAWLPRLLLGGERVLDIGANHGVYTVEIARMLGPRGHVWAFEPTLSPRQRLQSSVTANGLSERVTVVDAGLAERDGQASFATQANSELNSSSGTGTERETVQLLTLDGYLQRHASGRRIDFVKLDAEGDELRVLAGGNRFFTEQSPVVMFEFKHGNTHNIELVEAWRALGYDIFRLSPELGSLLPFDPRQDETSFALNLFAIRLQVQRELADRGLLARSAELAAVSGVPIEDGALPAWCERPALRGVVTAGDVGSGPYAEAVRAAAAAHRQVGLSPAERVMLLIDARERLLAALNDGRENSVEAWTLMLHILYALGQQAAAVDLGRRLLAQWTAGTPVSRPCVPPLREDLERRRTSTLGDWLRQCVAEFVELRSTFSSFFAPPSPQRWARLLEHPDHVAEVERRYLLASMRVDRSASLEHVRHLPATDATCNAQIWESVLDAMRQDASASSPAAVAEHADAAAIVLGSLVDTTVSIVDVGASSHGEGTEPYAALLRTGRGRVTAFEPDIAALAELQSQPGLNDARHRFLPHWVGDGGPATFHRTNWHMTGSLLRPNREWMDRYHDLGTVTQEQDQHPVSTVRLDDVIEPGTMDMLKIDVQGAELRAFDGASARLDECLVVWTEVEFAPLYAGQPLFADIDARLRRHGLAFFAFDGVSGRSLIAWPKQGRAQPRRQQMLWADAIYVPSPSRLAQLDAGRAARFALLAHFVLRAWDLCHQALQRHDALTGSCLAAAYGSAHRHL